MNSWDSNFETASALYLDTFSRPVLEHVSRGWLFLVLLSTFLFVRYISAVVTYHHEQRCVTQKVQLPPKVPYMIPGLGSAASFLFDNATFLRNATSYAGKLASTRVVVAGKTLFLFADRATVRKLWKVQSLSSPIPFYVHVLRHFFGMHEAALATYTADNSGAFPQPFAGSRVPERNRLDHLTHQGFKRAFTGPPLEPTAQRFMTDLVDRCEDLGVSEEWLELPDMLDFFRTVHGPALLQAVFGPSITKVNPGFVADFWKFDDSVPWLARMIPSFLNPEPYQVRERMRTYLKRWYQYARKTFTEDAVYEDGDGDPYWGSGLIRYLQKIYLKADNFDDDSLASADLGLVWGTLGNAIPTTMLTVYHIFKDPDLLQRVRASLELNHGQTALLNINPAELVKDPLLCSINAEVLRLYVTVCVMVSSPHMDVPLGRWCLPKQEAALVSSGIMHMDESFWNTRNGLHPVGSFWADRFLIDPQDSLSGPVQQTVVDYSPPEPPADGKPFFDLRGLEASFMPYGGGNAICPGRFLAKRINFFSVALMTREFDLEILPHTLEMGAWKFGMGVDKPKYPIPFRIRRRQLKTEG